MAGPVPSAFYLGRLFDLEKGQPLPQPVHYDPADLTTHAVVTGMTGSGKTGLCIGLLEEAALQGIPALIVDPKGDLGNLLLHFPNLAPQDFQPWIDPEAVRRQGKDLPTLAAETAARWQAGLAEWDITPERIAALQDAVRYSIYTPGSDAGCPVSILASFKAPGVPWEGNREILREKISATVTALLGLVGLTDVDPVRSREHILLANIFEAAWSQGKDLSLEELILQTQAPPFPKLGVFPVETFFPEKDRFTLAILLNNFLAAPAFQTWLEGQPLDIPALLYTPQGQPRHTIFYLAHLSDTERMFFVTLLFSAVETWMRTQSGTSGLRALLYFDEILGYLPPVSNPPSKPILLRMLKQARAFGVGLLLATQNPVDVDYKALSNAGTWFVGRLQTEQDKQRLLDGLESAAGGPDRGGWSRLQYDQAISNLRKRLFLLHNVHTQNAAGAEGAAGRVFQTRWTMNFLAGPLTRAQIPLANRLAEAAGQVEAPITPLPHPGLSAPPSPGGRGEEELPTPVPLADRWSPSSPPPSGEGGPEGRVREGTPDSSSAGGAMPPTTFEGTTTRPVVPGGVAEYFLPNDQSLSAALQARGQPLPENSTHRGLLYRPALLAQAEVRYLARKYGIDFSQKRTALVPGPDRRGMVRWEDFPFPALDPKNLDTPSPLEVRYAGLDIPLTDARRMASLQKDFLDWVYRASAIRLRANEALGVYAGPQAAGAEFREQCSQAARLAAEKEAAKAGATLDQKLRLLQDRLGKEQRELSQDEDELSQRRMEELGTHAENILGLFGRSKRRVSTSLSKHRLSQQARADVEESRQALRALQAQIAQLEREKAAALQEIEDRWAKTAMDASEVPLTPLKKDVYIDLFGVVWMPYYVVQSGDQLIELPGFTAGEG
jgi:hypothetical protein